MATWPSSLPDFQTPLQEDNKDIYLRTNMDVGPKKVRKRYSAVPRPFTATITIDGSQRSTLNTFYENNIRFDREDPLDDTVKEMRFAGPPRYNMTVGDENPNDRQYDVQIPLEVMP